MKHRKFVKQLMAAGMARNDAAECAALAANAKRPLYWVLGDLLNHHRDKFKVRGVLDLQPVRLTIIHGYKTPAYNVLINGFYNRAAWAVMRESVVHHPVRYSPDNLATQVGNNAQVMSRADHAALHGCVCGIDLAHGPDFTAGGGGND